MSDLQLLPTTELDAVNIILAGIGEDAVPSLEGDIAGDVATALLRLRTTSRSLQKQGWHFNIEPEVKLLKDGSGQVRVPNNTLAIKTAPDSDEFDLIQRGLFLYDRIKSTIVLDQDITAEITYFLPFDNLPEYARWYITVMAARRFLDGVMGDAASHQFSKQDELDAKRDFLDAELQASKLNLLRDSPTAITQR